MPKPLFILPVENQVRELDAKLLLACLAVQRGYKCVIGWKSLIDFRVGRFPPSIYFAKSLSEQNLKMLRILHEVGHFVVAWDEEAVVHYRPEIYYARRVGNNALKLIDILVAWGEDNRALLEGHPNFHDQALHVLGNPRSDLLRPELREYFSDEVEALRQRYGDFILINTNFGSINGYTDELNLVRKSKSSNGELEFGRGSLGMPADYARGLFEYRSKIFEAIRGLVPRIAESFAERRVVLRPHPAENHEFWRRQLRHFKNVEVVAEGNVISWLLACQCLVHNGCTTAVEGFVLGAKIISFVPNDDPLYENPLANTLGKRVSDPQAVVDQIHKFLGRSPETTNSRSNRELVARHMCALDGKLACQRIIDIVSDHAGEIKPTRAMARMIGIAHAESRMIVKCVERLIGVARYDRGFMRQRFPNVSRETLQAKADRLMSLVGGEIPVHVRRKEENVFEISAK